MVCHYGLPSCHKDMNNSQKDKYTLLYLHVFLYEIVFREGD